MRILLVEDHPQLAESVVQALKGAGWTVDLLQDGVAADLALASEEYALAILDVGLPRMDGFEVLARLREHPAVREAVVVAQPGAVGQQLVGYVVAQEPAVADSPEAQAECRAQLKTALRERLPEYMVPSHLLFLARMPLTPNGKLDRKGLPQPDASLLQQVYVAPRSDLEQQVAGIWAEVLQLQQVGLDDNFFELGGHSLLATQVIGRLRERLHLEVPDRKSVV